MCRLIRLTNIVDDSSVYINTSHIESLEVNKFNEVKIMCSHNYYIVKEHIDEILQLTNKRG